MEATEDVMLKNSDKFVELCKGLKLPLNGKFCRSTDILVGLIYEKYFENKILQSEVPVWKHKAARLSHLLKVTTNQTRYIKPTDDDVWIFGYGSLVWRPDFPFIDRKRGFICGYKRRFYQNSIDHRGTLERPGRVVTLLHTNDYADRVYGFAFRISTEHKDEVLAHLDHREKNGYERRNVDFYEFPESTECVFPITMYIATPDNESYAGMVWQIPDIALQILTAAGPSGPNREYLFNLARAMRELFPGVEDDHLFKLENIVRWIIKEHEATLLEKALKKEIADLIAIGDADGDVRETIRDFELMIDSCTRWGWREEYLSKDEDSLKSILVTAKP